MKKILLFFVLFAFSNESNAQVQNESWTCESLKQTYQIVLFQRGLVNLPITICDEMIIQRLQSERKTIQFSPYLKIILLSQDEINAGVKINQEITFNEN